MPFKNMSNDEEQEYFANGVTEDIIANLSSWKSFPVISRNSTFSFKGQDIKSSEVAQQLGRITSSKAVFVKAAIR
jgi:adenylate cyclase